MANILRNNIGSVVTVTAGNAVANNAYSVSGDKLTIDNTSNKALCADFTLTLSYATAPVTGSWSLMQVDYDLTNATAGEAPTVTLLGRFVGSFSPQPTTSNAVKSFVGSINTVALTDKADYYILNNGTGQSISTGWVLSAQCWTPG